MTMYFGALAFYGSSVKAITHVALCLDEVVMIEAGGGGSKTKTRADAAAQNAVVRVRPIRKRTDLVAILSPAAIRTAGAGRLALMQAYLFAQLGIPYRWGGDDPLDGWDCSGLVLEALTAFGLWSGGDTTAQGLYGHFVALAGTHALK